MRVRLAQVEPVGSFVMPLEIGVYLEGNAAPTSVETVELTGGRESFVIPATSEPTDVRLDPNRWALFRAHFGRAGGSGAGVR